MAALVVTDPVVISRKLSEFRDKGLIECTRGTIVILEPDELAQFAEIDRQSMFVIQD
jgi:hypothetical protein